MLLDKLQGVASATKRQGYPCRRSSFIFTITEPLTHLVHPWKDLKHLETV